MIYIKSLLLIIMSMFTHQRQKASFDKNILSQIIYDGKQGFKDFMRRQTIIDEDPILRFDPATLQRSRKQMMNIYAHKLIRYTELFASDDFSNGYKALFFEERMPLSQHDFIFKITLNNLCDAQQRIMFYQPACRNEIIGCYAQTQLGHGSDIKNLMTTATYDAKTETFVLNTPTVKAAKWWIGDLGVFCTHCIIFAQLIIGQKRYGIHSFIVQIRDNNHKPLQGIQVGDIGPKSGFNVQDNGYLILKDYRVPRKNMLMKYHRLSSQGKYQIVGDPKITYATMLRRRATIPSICFTKYAKAITIITRYSIVRSQFKDARGKEIPIIDYQLQQEKIFPRIAETYANLFAFKSVWKLAEVTLQEAERHNFNNLNEVHIITSAIKAITTKDATKGLEIIRRAGGGQAFSAFSGLTNLQNQLNPAFTYEGQYTILQLQIARFLIKSMNRAIKGESIVNSVGYLAKIIQEPLQLDTSQQRILLNTKNLLQIFEFHSIFHIKKAAEKLNKRLINGKNYIDVWNMQAGIELVQAGTAHCYYLMVRYFIQNIQQKVSDAPLKRVMQKLCLLYCIEKILQFSFSFYQSKLLTSQSLKAYRQILQKLFVQLRPDILTLVQAFAFSDNNLHTAIGRSDGKTYETLLDWAKNKNDVNKEEHAILIRQEQIRLRDYTSAIFKSKL